MLISCANNQLTSVPKEISQLPNVTVLDFRGNPLLPRGENENLWGQEELRARFGNRVLMDGLGEQKPQSTNTLVAQTIEPLTIHPTTAYEKQVDGFISALKKANPHGNFSGNPTLKANLLKGKFLAQFNDLSVLPSEIGNLIHIKDIDIGNNKLEILPHTIDKLIELKSIDMEHNEFTEFPRDVLNLTKLDDVNIADNQLTSLPSDIKRLVNLTSLSVNSNQLTLLN